MNEVLPFRQQTLALCAFTIVRSFDAPFDAGNTREGPVKTARPSERYQLSMLSATSN
jgi:hypothetical protein